MIRTMNSLWDYMNSQYGISLTGSEIDDILALARQEIELPDEDEIRLNAFKETRQAPIIGHNWWYRGAQWALNKVRNPYPKPM